MKILVIRKADSLGTDIIISIQEVLSDLNENSEEEKAEINSVPKILNPIKNIQDFLEVCKTFTAILKKDKLYDIFV